MADELLKRRITHALENSQLEISSKKIESIAIFVQQYGNLEGLVLDEKDGNPNTLQTKELIENVLAEHFEKMLDSTSLRDEFEELKKEHLNRYVTSVEMEAAEYLKTAKQKDIAFQERLFSLW